VKGEIIHGSLRKGRGGNRSTKEQGRDRARVVVRKKDLRRQRSRVEGVRRRKPKAKLFGKEKFKRCAPEKSRLVNRWKMGEKAGSSERGKANERGKEEGDTSLIQGPGNREERKKVEPKEREPKATG